MLYKSVRLGTIAIANEPIRVDGIERKGNKGSGDSSNSFFNKNGAASPQNSNRGRSNSTTMEDIEDMMS